MDQMTSTEFRKRYSRAVKPIAVTANGHPIGTWIPAGLMSEMSWGNESQNYRAVGYVEADMGQHLPPAPTQIGTTLRPFRPVPKPSQKR